MTATPQVLTARPAWKALEANHQQVRELHLRKLFADDPGRGERLTAEAAGITLVRKLAGQDLAVREGLRRKLESLRAEVGGPAPTPLERLLVERIVACWLHLYHLEANYAGKDSMPLELATYYQRSLSAAHKRYLSAIRTLAVVRKLAMPVLQVNIARKQVNVAGPCVAPE
jgi:hypothetical protein